jgi:hypothetical protein
MKKENKWVHQNMIGVYPPLSNRDCRGCDPMVVGIPFSQRVDCDPETDRLQCPT